MKLIVAIIRPEKLADVKRALFQVGVTGMTLSLPSGPRMSSARVAVDYMVKYLASDHVVK